MAAMNLSAPVRLPSEILANIFFMVQYNSGDAYDSEGLPPVQLLAGVCSYWRHVAINSPPLWTCIDITTTKTNFNYATLSLNRSNNYPIHLSISEPRERVAGFPWYKGLGTKPSAFLVRASQRIHTLNIESYGYYDTTIEMMEHWLKHGAVGMTKALLVRRSADIGPRPLEWNSGIQSSERAKNILRSVTVLRLREVAIPWISVAYHNLIDLQLWFNPSYMTRISVSELASILTSSLGLVTVKICGLGVTPSNDWDPTTAVPLVHLEVLYLGELSLESCELLLPLIPLSACLNDLSIGLRFDGAHGIAPLIQESLRDTPTRTLACFGSALCRSPQWVQSLVGVIPSLENLVLDWYYLPDAYTLRTTAPEHQPALCLPHLFIVSSSVNLESLKFLISRYGVQAIHLERCGAYDPAGNRTRTPSWMDKFRESLLETFPDLVCIISDVETTSEWPCCTVFY